MTDLAPSPPSFPARTAEELQTEFAELVGRRQPEVAAKVSGDGFTLQLQTAAGTSSTAVTWINACHHGVLGRLPDLFDGERAPTSFELLAIARHLFETLIWLRLFKADLDWGVHFYAQLLANERQDLDGLIARHHAELARFRGFADEEAAISEAVTVGLVPGETLQSELARRLAAREERLAELDARVRAGFNMHSGPATFNGYAFQAQLIETQHLARAEAEREAVQARLDAFKAEIGDTARVDRYLTNWNWKAGAKAVGLVEQYDFFYRLTSRLLHATPMNLVTEKALTDGERLLLLEFVVVATTEAFDLMETFTFPGQLNVVAISMDEA